MRNPKYEKTAVSNKLKLEIDHADAFDYATGVSTVFQKDDYLKIVLNEVKTIHDNHLR